MLEDVKGEIFDESLQFSGLNIRPPGTVGQGTIPTFSGTSIINKPRHHPFRIFSLSKAMGSSPLLHPAVRRARHRHIGREVPSPPAPGHPGCRHFQAGRGAAAVKPLPQAP